MVYESIIEDMEIVQGDSSDVWYIGMPDGRQLDGGDWFARYVIATAHGKTPVVNVPLSLNSGTGDGDVSPVGTKFVFRIDPADSAILSGNKKYKAIVELTNTSIKFNREVARFTLKVLTGN